MSSNIVFQNEDATLMYHDTDKIVHHEFHRPIASETFRQVLNMGVDIFKNHEATKWLSDDRKNGALSDDDSTWAKTDWFPRVLGAGWKFWALVVPEDIMARMNLVQFVSPYMEMGLMVRVFTKPEDALGWLRKA